MKAGTELISQERYRQTYVEGWTAKHDDSHIAGELTAAARAYAQAAFEQVLGIRTLPMPEYWPFEKAWWKPAIDPIHNLIKAGALIAAEIDRLQRKAGTIADGWPKYADSIWVKKDYLEGVIKQRDEAVAAATDLAESYRKSGTSVPVTAGTRQWMRDNDRLGRKERLKASGLAKLSHEEREALGV